MEYAETVVVGTTIELTGVFTAAGTSTATDPSNMLAKIRRPGGAVVTKTYGVSPELTKTGTGVYVLRYELDIAGTYWISYEGTGAVDVVEEVAFHAKRRIAA